VRLLRPTDTPEPPVGTDNSFDGRLMAQNGAITLIASPCHHRSTREQHRVSNRSESMSQNEIKKPLFSLGRIVATPGALDAL
jgi:hypothetical protein